MDTFDELIQMDNPVPMSAQTPTEYTMINGWFLDIADSGGSNYSHRYLSGGAIKTGDWTDDILVLKLDGITADPVASDIGKTVTDDGVDVGPLLGYEIDPDGANTGKWWIRNTTGGAVTIADNSSMAITGGTGAGTANGDSETGENLWANIYTLGTIETSPAPQIYVFQAGEAIAEWSTLSNWDRGHIDVLILVKEADTEIDDGKVTVFARQGGDLYDNYEIDLTAGGSNAVPLSTKDDLDHTTGDFYMLYDAEAGGGFAVGDIIKGATSGSEAEVVAITDWGTEGLLELIGVTGDFTDNENLQVDGTTKGVANGCAAGCLGDTYMRYDNEVNTLAVNTIYYVSGGSTARRRLIGKQDDGTTGKVVLRTDPENDSGNESKHFIKFADNETFTDGTNSADVNEPTEGYSFQSVYWYRDIQIVFVNLELDYDGGTGAINVGDTVTGATSGASGYVLKTGAVASGTLTLGNWNGTAFQDNENLQVGGATKAVANGTGKIANTMNKAFEQQSAYPYDVIIDLNFYSFSEGHTVAEMYEFLKLVCGQNQAFLQTQNMYPRYKDTIDGAVADDGGSQTDETSAAQDTTADDMTLLPATPAVNDAYYFGSDDQFGKLRLNITTAGSGTWTITWEYYNGVGWSALNWQGAAGIGEDTTDASQFTPSAAGWVELYWDIPTDWATTSVSGISAYWVRARVSAYTSITTQPKGGQAYVFDLGDKKLDGEEYIQAFDDYSPQKVSPLGTFAGGTFFGAQGVWIENMHSNDVKAFQLIDSNGVVRNPPNKQACSVTSLVSGDRVAVFRTASAGETEPKKDIYTSHATNNVQGDSTFEIQESIAVDTPSSGIIRVVDASANTEHRIRYDSWSGSIFTMPTEISGTTTAAGGTNTITDSGATFTTEDIEEGDIVRNSTDGSWAQVVSVDSDTQITTTDLQGGTDNTWASADGYSFHTLPVTYTGSDTAYVPFIDDVATSSSVSVTVIYTADRSIVTRVRKKGIIPFQIAGTFGSTGYTVAAIRTTDSIVT